MALDFLAGCLGGCAGVIVGHPFDTIKVKLQTQDARNPRYKGTWHCLLETVKQDSFRGLYRGMSSPMAGVAVVNAIIFGVHGNIMKKMDNPDLLRSHFLAGTTAGFLQSFISSPMELCKTRMQIITEASKGGELLYNNAFDCLKKIYKTEGLKGIFRGQTITILREIPGFGAYFVSYEWIMRKTTSDNQNFNTLAVLGAGGMAGIASWTTSYPMDVVKSRLQADGMIGKCQYKGIVDCVKKSIQTEGWSVMTRGLSTTIIRAFPTNAATFAVVNWTMDLFAEAKESKVSAIHLWDEILSTGDNIIHSVSAPVYRLNYRSDHSNYSAIKCSLIQEVLDNKLSEIEFLESDKDCDTPEAHTLTNCSDSIDPESTKDTESASDKPYTNPSVVPINECLHTVNDSRQLNLSKPQDCRSRQSSFSKVSQVVIEVNFCDICGRCARRGAQMIFNTSSSLCCLTLRHQTLSNTL